VTLVCVTKEAALPDIRQALDLGVTDIGENRVQDAVLKHGSIGPRPRWHLIGHLQTNKARDAVRIFDLVHSVDSLRAAREIDKEAGRIKKVQDVLIQVNTSGEASKFGVAPEETERLIKELILYPNISIKGLMTMAPETDDPETSRPFFRRLKELLKALNERRATSDELRLLSMGMSGDFEVAIEEGSNMLRIGRAIFGQAVL
jgi:pyridoxal phosphate enzyme (YggS family)